MRTTPNINISVWNNLSDSFSHTELATNWDNIDAHNHTTGAGAPLGANTVGTTQIQDNAVTSAKIPNNAIGTTEIVDNAITTGKIADNQVTTAKIVGNAIDANRLADAAVWAKFPIVSTLPGAPADGQIVMFQTAAMATDGVVWSFRYRAAAANNKWEFIGGGPWRSQPVITGGAAAPSTANQYLSLNGQPNTVVTVPLAGYYQVEWGCNIWHNVAGTTSTMAISLLTQDGLAPNPGVPAATGGFFPMVRIEGYNAGMLGEFTGSRSWQFQVTATTGGTPNNEIRAVFRVGSTSNLFNNPWMSVTPIRVGG